MKYIRSYMILLLLVLVTSMSTAICAGKKEVTKADILSLMSLPHGFHRMGPEEEKLLKKVMLHWGNTFRILKKIAKEGVANKDWRAVRGAMNFLSYSQRRDAQNEIANIYLMVADITTQNSQDIELLKTIALATMGNDLHEGVVDSLLKEGIANTETHKSLYLRKVAVGSRDGARYIESKLNSSMLGAVNKSVLGEMVKNHKLNKRTAIQVVDNLRQAFLQNDYDMFYSCLGGKASYAYPASDRVGTPQNSEALKKATNDFKKAFALTSLQSIELKRAPEQKVTGYPREFIGSFSFLKHNNGKNVSLIVTVKITQIKMRWEVTEVKIEDKEHAGKKAESNHITK